MIINVNYGAKPSGSTLNPPQIPNRKVSIKTKIAFGSDFSSTKTSAYYSVNAPQYCKDTIEKANLDKMEMFYRVFLPLLPEGAKILDAGCGAGRDTNFFVNKGFDVTPIDGNAEIAKEAEKYTGKTVPVIDFNNREEFVKQGLINKFDGVWACASLVHAENLDRLHNYISNLTDTLKKDGKFFINIKYGDKLKFDVDKQGRNMLYLNEEVFKGIIREHNNLNIVSLETAPDPLGRTDTTWLLAVLGKK